MRLIDWHPDGLLFSGDVRTFRSWLQLLRAHIDEYALILKGG